MLGTRHTENYLGFVFSNPQAKLALYHLEGPSRFPYEQVRMALGIAPETFHRITRRLAQFDLLRLRAPRGGEFEGRRVRLVLELSPKGRNTLSVLHDLDCVLVKHKGIVGTRVVEQLHAVQ